RLKRRKRSLSLLARLVNLADGKERAAAAERARRAVNWLRNMDLIAASVQHRDRGVEVLALEVAIEGIGEEYDFFLLIRLTLSAVMPGLVPGIHALLRQRRGWPGQARP